MLRFALCFCVGILAFQQVSALPGPNGLMLLVPGLLLAWRWPAARPAAWLAFGYAWAQCYAIHTLPPAIPDADDGPVLYQATGSVVSLPERLTGRTRFLFRVDTLDGSEGTYRGQWQVRVTWRNAPGVRPGEVWRLPLRLKAVHGYASPGAWDYEGHLYRRGVRYTGYVSGDAPLTARRADKGRDPVLRARHALSRWLDERDSSDFSRGVIRALVVADRSGLSAESKRIFRETGTSHLMAVSGLHIGLVAGMGFLIVGPVWRRLPSLCNRVPARVAATLVGLVCAIAYALLAGMQLPTQRASIMLAVYAATFLLRRRAGPWNALALSAVAVLLWHPPSVLEAGFWLSFGAVLVITATLQHGQGHPRWRQAISVQLAVTLALWPVLALFGMSTSILAPMVNLVLVPVFGVLVVPLSLGGTAVGTLYPDAGAAILEGLSVGLDLIGGLLAWASATGLPMPAMQGAMVLIALTLLALLLWLQPAGLPMRPFAGLLLIGLFLPRASAVPVGEFRVQILDVGQGLAVVVETHAHVLVFDTGPAFNSGFSTASAVLLPYLKRRDLRRIDRLVLSHGDRDHAGGLDDLFRHMPVSELVSGEPERVGFGAGPCRAGDRWAWDGVVFEFLHPEWPTSLQGNDVSCVLRVSNAAGSALLTGDIGRSVETMLVEHHADRLVSRLVIAPHHGSRSSSSRPFVTATRADFVVYAAGWGNRYGFPAPDVVRRWERAGAHSLDTARAGSIGFRFARDGSLVGPTRHRAASRRYWRHVSSSAADLHAVSSGD